MSIILLTATSHYILISGDKRAIYPDGRIDNNFSKIFRVNNNIIIGFTGSGVVPVQLKNHGYLNEPDNVFPREYTETMFDILGENKIHHETNIVIAGKTDSNRVYISIFKTDSKDIECQRELNDSEIFNFVMSPIEYADMQFQLNCLYRERVESIDINSNSFVEDVKEIQSDFIKEISKNALSVNSNVETIVL